MVQVLGRILSALGPVRFATSGEKALEKARVHPPDLMLLDVEMQGLSGFEVCEAMKADPALCNVPVILVTAHGGGEFELKGLEAGASDFITKPVSEPLLLARVRTQLRVKRLTDELRWIATIDALTEVSNRGTFDAVLRREWKRGARSHVPMSLLMVDVDHFKLFNDHYGHPAGDSCLRLVAQALKSVCLRPADLVARYGGEEFVLLLPETPRAGAEHVASRVLAAVAALGIPHEASLTAAHVTVSIGISYYDEHSPSWAGRAVHPAAKLPARTPQDMVRCADHALYEAKHRGRAQARQLDLDEPTTWGRAHPSRPPPSIGQASATDRRPLS